MPRHIVLHPGFHKTGTTSLQNGLKANRKLLPRSFGVVSRNRIDPLCSAAMRYSDSGQEIDLAMIRYEAAALARRWRRRNSTTILSHENLAGSMPGRAGRPIYPATAQILPLIVESFLKVHPGCRISVLFTTRDPASWLASCYWQLMRQERMHRDLDSFVAAYTGSFDLGQVVKRVTDALPAHHVTASDVSVFTARRLGPLDAILDLTDITDEERSKLIAPTIANRRPSPEIRQKLAEIDRSDLSDDAAARAKKKLLDQLD